MTRGAFTLFEVLVAIALLVAAASLAAPSLARRMSTAVFDESTRQLDSVMALCRADALRLGRPVALVARPGRDGLVLYAEPLETWSGNGDDTLNGAAGFEAGGAGRLALFALPGGVRVASERPLPSTVLGSEILAPPPDWPGADLFDDMAGPEEPLTLAVFLPDGGALETDPFWLTGPEGRSVEVRVSAATGRPTVRPVRDAAGPVGGPARPPVPESDRRSGGGAR